MFLLRTKQYKKEIVLKKIWSAKWYVLIGLVSYLIWLTLTAPLEYVWPKLQPYAPPLPVKIQQVQGTVWQGKTDILVPNMGQVTAVWDVDIADLFFGKLSAQMTAKGQKLTFKGVVSGTAEKIEIKQAKAFLSSQYLKPMLRQGRSSLTGDFELNQFNGVFSIADKQILAAEGQLLFSGGDVSFPLDGKNVNATLPILVGLIEKPADNVEIKITNTNGDNIGDGYIQPDGWAGIGIRRRFLDILGLQWPAEIEADKIIFEASQKLL